MAASKHDRSAIGENPMATVRKYSKHFWAIMRNQGFSIDFEDMVGEMSLVYALSIDRFAPEKAGSKTHFETYLFKACQNRVTSMKKEIVRESTFVHRFTDATKPSDMDEGFARLDVNFGEGGSSNSDCIGVESLDGFTTDPLQVALCADTIRAVRKGLSERDALIFDELCCPSDRVMERMKALTANGARGTLYAAISDAHEIPMWAIYESVKNIRGSKNNRI